MSSDQKGLVQEVLQKLIEPYRQSDRDEALTLPEGARRTGQVLAGVLSRRRHRQRPGLGLLAAGRPVVRLVLPRRPARPRVGQRGRRRQRENERVTHRLAELVAKLAPNSSQLAQWRPAEEYAELSRRPLTRSGILTRLCRACGTLRRWLLDKHRARAHDGEVRLTPIRRVCDKACPNRR